MSALRRFPLVLLCGWVGTAAAIACVLSDGEGNYDKYLRLALTATLGMPLFFSLHLLSERGKRWAGRVAPFSGILLLAACYYWLIPAPSDWAGWLPLHLLPNYQRMEYGWTSPPFYGWPMLAGMGWWLALAGLHFLAASLANWRVFLRFWWAALYSGVLLAGLELALLSADHFFALHLDNAYICLLFIIAGCIQPAYFLAGIPRDFDAPDPPRWLTSFAQFALAPFVAVGTVILYASVIKMILARTWPDGVVAMPAFILACAGILCALLLHPLRGESWAGCYCKSFPRALAPLALLLVLSVWERIAAYGVTEFRYLGIVFGLWIAAWALVYIIRQDAGTRWIPASLAVICVASAFGPWSAGTVSRNSQYSRLTKIFRAHGLMSAEEFHPPRTPLELPGEETASIRSIINYLVNVHGAESVHRLFDVIVKEDEWPELAAMELDDDILFNLNLRDDAHLFYDLKRKETANIEGFRQLTRQYLVEIKGRRSYDGLTLHDGVLWMKTSDEARAEPVPADAFFRSLRGKGDTLTSAQLTLDWTQQGRPFRVIFRNLLLVREAGKPLHIQFGVCLLCEQ